VAQVAIGDRLVVRLVGEVAGGLRIAVRTEVAQAVGLHVLVLDLFLEQ